MRGLKLIKSLIHSAVTPNCKLFNYFNGILAIFKGKTYLYFAINGFSFSLLTEVAFLKSDSVHCNN